MDNIIAKNVLLSRLCANCTYYCDTSAMIHDNETVNVACDKTGTFQKIDERGTCEFWEEDIYWKYKNRQKSAS